VARASNAYGAWRRVARSVSQPVLSLVVPAHNEADYLPALLASVAAARRRYARGADAVEVIVVDNASTDGTAQVARDHGCRVVRVTERSIAAARNGGAREARADWIAFVDADCVIHPDTFDALDRALSRDDVVIGATGVRMSRSSAGIRISTLLIDAVNHLRAIDTGVVFCRRADWAAVGGYDERRRFGEDLGFMLAMKRLGRKRGRRFVRPSGVRAITSSRKFDRHGDWHYFRALLNSVVWLVDRKRLDRFVQRYWYDDRG
jgi:glycosyltransferase involved in cell wall biosynthesis